jgi:PqqD family protein of HPr-rel-A system
MHPDSIWQIARGVVCKASEADDEMAVYVGFTGTAHVLSEVGYLVIDACLHGPESTKAIARKAHATFEQTADVDLNKIVEQTIHQLHTLGILTPCVTIH